MGTVGCSDVATIFMMQTHMRVLVCECVHVCVCVRRACAVCGNGLF